MYVSIISMIKALVVKKKIGRPCTITKDKITELASLFMVGSTVDQACDYAGIGRESYYRMLERSQDFRNKMAYAQSFVNVESKRVVVNDILVNKEVKTALELLKNTEWRPKETTAFATDGDNAVKFIITRG